MNMIVTILINIIFYVIWYNVGFKRGFEKAAKITFEYIENEIKEIEKRYRQ